jgi:Cu/Ag efflux pump CusA
VTKNAILLVDFTNQALRAGRTLHEAILEAGQVRLRPILMTTLAMIFGMLPMAIGVGAGGELLAPMGRAVIGGVITSTLLTLLIVPVLYTYIYGFTARVRAYLRRGRTHAVEVVDQVEPTSHTVSEPPALPNPPAV